MKSQEERVVFIKVLLAYVFYLLVLVSGLNFIWTVGYFLFENVEYCRKT